MFSKIEKLSSNQGKEMILKFISGIKTKDIIISVISLLISRATLMDELTPFGISFMISYIIKYNINLLVPITSSLGLMSVHGKGAIPYLITIWVLFLASSLSRKEKESSVVKIGIFTVALFTITKSLYIFMNDYYLYDVIMTLLEGVIIFTLIYIFTYGINTIQSNYSREFTSEEIICGAIMLALSISGLQNISMYGVALKSVVGITLVLILAYNKGASVGSTVGITIGIVTSMSQHNLPLVIAVYGVAGLLSGLFKDLGKIGSGVGFLIGSSIISFYIDGTIGNILKLKEVAVGIVLFLIISKLVTRFNSNIILGVSKSIQIEEAYSSRLKDITNKRLSEMSTVFRELAATFEKVAEKKQPAQQKDISKLIDTVSKDICQSCDCYKSCWEDDFYITYQEMFEIANVVELGKSNDEDILEHDFDTNCKRSNLIVNKIKDLFQVYKLDCKWENKILESRQLVSQQLEGISNIIEDLASQVYEEVKFKQDVEKNIYNSLRNMRIDILEVIVTETEKNDFEIFLELSSSTHTNTIKNMPKLVSDIVGLELTTDKFYSNTSCDSGNIKLKLLKGNKFGATTKVCRLDEGFNYISGDSYTFGERKNNYYVALSDGMGMGHKAKQESNIAISLLEKFLEAGFDKELALKTINSILLIKSTDEMSTTIDMSVTDLYRGKTKFIKVGSAPTFIKRKEGVEIINSHTLPVGILKDVDFQVYEKDLEDGDFIITVSDGVLDANEGTDDKEKWLSDIIQKIDNFNPQTIADKIIDEALEVSEDAKRDDMTVLVTKIWKRV